MKRILREMRDAGCNISEWHDTEAGERNQQQRRFARTSSTARNGCATSTPRMFVPDQIPADGEHGEYEFRYRRGHSAQVCGVRSGKLALGTGVPLREPSSATIERAPSAASVWYRAETGPHTSR